MSTFRLLARTFLPSLSKEPKFPPNVCVRTNVRFTLTTGTFNLLSKTESAFPPERCAFSPQGLALERNRASSKPFKAIALPEALSTRWDHRISTCFQQLGELPSGKGCNPCNSLPGNSLQRARKRSSTPVRRKSAHAEAEECQ